MRIEYINRLNYSRVNIGINCSIVVFREVWGGGKLQVSYNNEQVLATGVWPSHTSWLKFRFKIMKIVFDRMLSPNMGWNWNHTCSKKKKSNFPIKMLLCTITKPLREHIGSRAIRSDLLMRYNASDTMSKPVIKDYRRVFTRPPESPRFR